MIPSNKIEVSEFGLDFIRKLPVEIEEENQADVQDKQNKNIYEPKIQKRGHTVDFHFFANQTMQLLHRQTQGVSSKFPQTASESKRKLQLHHDQWVSEQKVISHKLADIQSRLQYQKYSEYDWQSISTCLKQHSHQILYKFQERNKNHRLRTQSKLKRIFARKYPNRSHS